MKKILFLYTEIAEYFLACLAALETRHVQVEVIRWPLNSEAPFRFRSLTKTKFYGRKDFTDDGLLRFAEKLRPDVIFCSGWIDHGYNLLCRHWVKKIPVVLLLDNHWTGHWKQRVAAAFSRFVVRDKFSHAWVPGEPQLAFVKRLGFANDKVCTGYYVADTVLFEKFYTESFVAKQKTMPKRLLYIGRYLGFKGITDLWSAFAEISTEYPDWELWCLGTGDLWENRAIHPRIVHHGFIQPHRFGEFINNASVFVLPSRKEPWGVVVHEMAAAGMPMLCSSAVGAATQFLKEGKNGYLHDAGDIASLKTSLKKIMSLPDVELRTMATFSHELSKSLTPANWAATVFNLACSASGPSHST